MSRAWRHTLCLSCWTQLHPGRHPVLLNEPATELCCNCGVFTDTPVYYRAEPQRFPCKGWHDPILRPPAGSGPASPGKEPA